MNIINQAKKLFCICIILTFGAQPVFAHTHVNKIVAIVNNDIISQSELDNHVKLITSDLMQAPGSTLPPKDVLQQQVLSKMIQDNIQLQLAEQVGIEVDSFTVSQAIQDIAKEQGLKLDNFKSAIEDRGISFSDYRNLIKSDLTIQYLQNKEVSQDISISKVDIEGYLSSPAGQDNSGAEYRLNHILLSQESVTTESIQNAEQLADALAVKLKNGANFNKIAMTESSGRQALKGGDLGWRTAGELPTLFVNHVSTMQIGDVIGPIRNSSGFHIIKLQDKRIPSKESRLETKVRQILIKPDAKTSSKEAEAKLISLQQQIKKGSDFAKLAEKNSQESITASKGGNMGWITKTNVLPKFHQVMSKLKNNEVSEPFLTEDGWNLIKVLDRRTQLTSNEAVWNKAKEILTMRKTNEAIEAWSKRIRDEAQIEIFLPTKLQDKNI